MGNAQIKTQSQAIEGDVEDDDSLYVTRMPTSARRYKSTSPEPDAPQPAKLITRATRVTPVVQAAPKPVSAPLPKPKSAPLPKQDTRVTDDNGEAQPKDPITQGNPVLRRRSSLPPTPTPAQQGVVALDIPAVTPSIMASVVSDDIASSITERLPVQKKFPLIPVLIGSVVTIVLVMTLSALGSWWHTYQDDQQYGRPRTSQLDAIVGHSDSATHPSHFIFLNLHRHVEIIEISGGDAAHTHIYTGPVLYGDGQDLTPIIGEFKDVNHNGKPELIVHIGDQQIVYVNDGTTFHLQ